MATSDPEPPTTAERPVEDQTTAPRTRTRRVSFADTTLVRVFDRDEDYETPPDSTVGSTVEPSRTVPGEEEHNFVPVVRGLEDSSPGSAVGSVTSNDDEYLFGPVSSSFIRSGQLSEASEDDHHDITLDSTTFSLHFRNALPSDDQTLGSAGSLRTPTGDSSSAILKGARKQVLGGTAFGESNGSSNHMSFVSSSNEYGYGKLSSSDVSLFQRVNESLGLFPPKNDNKVLSSSSRNNDPIESTLSENKSLGEFPNATEPTNRVSSDGKPADAHEIKHGPNMCLSTPISEPNSDATRQGPRSSFASPPPTSERPVFVAEYSLKRIYERFGRPSPSAGLQSPSLPGGSTSGLSVRQQMLSLLSPSPQIQPASASSVAHYSYSSPIAKDNSGGKSSAVRDTILNLKRDKPVTAGLLKFRSPSSSPQSMSEFQSAGTDANLLTSACGTIFVTAADGHTIAVSGNNSRKVTSCPPELVEKMPSQSQKVDLAPHVDGSTYSVSVHAENGNLSPISSSFEFPIPGEREGLNRWSPIVSKDSPLCNKEMEKQVNDASNSNGENVDWRIIQQRDNVVKNSPKRSETVHIPGAEPCQMADKDSLPTHHFRELNNNPIQASQISSYDSHQDPGASKKSFLVSVSDNVGKKRRSGRLSRDGDLMKETKRMQMNMRISELERRISRFSEKPDIVRSELCKGGHMIQVKHWKDVFSNISSIIEKLQLPVDKLNLAELDVFEDILNDFRRARESERLYNNIASLGKHDYAIDEHQRRLAEVKYFQEMVMFKQAKIQLMKSKRDLMLKMAQDLKCGIEECHKLKSMVKQKSHFHNGKCTTMNSFSKDNSSIKNQEKQKKVALMRNEITQIEEKLKGTVHIFEVSCNIKDNMSFEEIIGVVSDRLKWLRLCRSVRQDLLPWKVVEAVHQNNECHILLDYQNLLTQRFRVKALSGSCLSLQNSVNTISIDKRFPNMKASIAFHYIFDTEDVCTLADLTCIKQHNQNTSFIFGNLVDLLEEVQASVINSSNLVSSSFCSLPACKLGLELAFVNLHNGREVILTLDMSSLKGGYFPSEPSELQVNISVVRKATPTISDEIMSIIHCLSSGPSLFSRLCECVSQAFESPL